MDKICKICNKTFENDNHFWLDHHLSKESYYRKYFPRFCKLTQKPIPFKSSDQYLSQDFLGKNELKKWLKENPEEGKEYCLNFLEKRFNEGKSLFAPSQVELRSLCCPTIVWYSNFFNYNSECSNIGMKTKFYYNLDESSFKLKNSFNGTIYIDTREQKQLSFKKLGLKEVVKKLDYGDYCSDSSIHKHLFFERKGLSDFISTLSGGYDRFCREIERAKENDHYLIILVESPITDALAFNMLPYVSRKIKASPSFVFHKVRELMQKFDNIQFVFVNNRESASKLIKTIYSMDSDAIKYDWQYLIDKKIVLND